MKISDTARLLIIDDQQTPRHDWFTAKFPNNPRTHALKFWEGIDALEANEFDVLFLDHDLNDDGKGDVESGMYGSRELTGADIASWLTRNLEKLPPHVIVHSVNPAGARNIQRVLESHCKVSVIPFTELITFKA